MNEMLLNRVNVELPTGDVEFLGETNSLITYTTLSTTFGVTQGTINSTTQANKWLQFKLDGKELYISKVAIRNSITWDHLYSKGLVYGTTDNGLYPTGTPTNQYKTITLNGKLYKCRLLKGVDPGINQVSINGLYDNIESQQSEWSRLFYPIVTNDPNVTSYTGPMLANYTEADLQMRYVNDATTPGTYNWCQEGEVSNATQRVIRGNLGPSFLSWNTSSFIHTRYGWRVCLELV